MVQVRDSTSTLLGDWSWRGSIMESLLAIHVNHSSGPGFLRRTNQAEPGMPE